MRLMIGFSSRVVALLVAAAALFPARAAVPEYQANIVKSYPHDPQAFTEGLLFHQGFLYESTGQEGQSDIRKVELETGRVVLQRKIDKKYFGEGIVIWKSRLVELTWRDAIGFTYDVNTFKPLSNFSYTGEGWALTRNETDLFMSDGSSSLRTLDPTTLAERSHRIQVTCDGKPVRNINELEWVKGEIFANVWLTNLIVRINPTTGQIVGIADLTALKDMTPNTQAPDNVLNGIAYDTLTDRLFVTGKFWPTLYQITLTPRPNGSDLCSTLP
jgi:glutaminyl-peptide cyclotransferase